MITMLVMTDGRADCLARSMATYDRLAGPIHRRVIHDDSGDAQYLAHLRRTYPDWTLITTGQRSGFAGAYRSAWGWLATHCDTDWVFSTEDDFEIGADVDLAQMAVVLAAHPHLAQMALQRQPWNEREREAGGIVAMDRPSFTPRTDGVHDWLEHRKFYTTNPHLVAASFVRRHEWPAGRQSEGRFSVGLFRSDPAVTCGFWGTADDPPRVHHIGAQRAGVGY